MKQKPIWKICSGCEGNGTRMTASIAEHAYSREDFDADPDFEEAYFGGHYDVRCWECNGLGRVDVAKHEDVCEFCGEEMRERAEDEVIPPDMRDEPYVCENRNCLV